MEYWGQLLYVVALNGIFIDVRVSLSEDQWFLF